MCNFDNFKPKSKSSSKQYANLQRTALLYMKGAFYAPLTCSCLYLIPRGRKYPHKYRGLNSGWTQEPCSCGAKSLDGGCVWLLCQVCLCCKCNGVCLKVWFCKVANLQIKLMEAVYLLLTSSVPLSTTNEQNPLDKPLNHG